MFHDLSQSVPGNDEHSYLEERKDGTDGPMDLPANIPNRNP